MTATLDRPVKEPAFHPLSGRRKATNAIATVLVSSAVLIALVPLVWVLYTVFDRGFAAILSADWWFKSQNMMTNRIAGGGAYHAPPRRLPAPATASSPDWPRDRAYSSSPSSPWWRSS
ncbi:Putative phosphate ABC transporter%2C permease protein [Mycobacteroides abscessus]|nr:Putative phosphate ABC transporter%2C permease protein [Mycobacteroides abscessus]